MKTKTFTPVTHAQALSVIVGVVAIAALLMVNLALT